MNALSHEVPADGMVSFRNSQGLQAQGTLMNVTRQAVEMDDPHYPYSWME